MRRRWLKVCSSMAIVLAVATGCGDAGSPSVPQSEDAAQQDSSSDQSQEGSAQEGGSDPLAFELEGYASDDSGASAQLLIREDDGVRLSISSGVEGEGYLLMTLQLTELEAVMGEHDWELELPLPEAVGSVDARLGGADYYSQGGQAHILLDSEGHIEGDFSVDLALLPTERTLVPYRVRSEFETVSGSFAGGFNVSCYSRVPAHSTWLEGGTYCEELEL